MSSKDDDADPFAALEEAQKQKLTDEADQMLDGEMRSFALVTMDEEGHTEHVFYNGYEGSAMDGYASDMQSMLAYHALSVAEFADADLVDDVLPGIAWAAEERYGMETTVEWGEDA